MSIRIRHVHGLIVALCAAETDPEPGDIYLDDAAHHALTAKFARDFDEVKTEYPLEWAVMDSQKKRDAKEELEKWLMEQS